MLSTQQHHSWVRLGLIVWQGLQVAHVFQYSLNPVHELIRFDQLWMVDPDDDAFTFTWKAVLRRLCEHGKLKPERCLDAKKPSGRTPLPEMMH